MFDDGLEDARGGRHDFHVHLVSFQLDNGLAGRDGIAFALAPLANSGLDDRFTQLGYLDFN